jgi:putative oxidoreductase
MDFPVGVASAFYPLAAIIGAAPMYADAHALDIAGRLLIVACFLATGLSNLTRARVQDHIERMKAARTPFPAAAFWIGIALQLAGSAMLLADWHPAIGALCLIVFIVVATLVFHRFWSMQDATRRNSSRINLLGNLAILGGLLLLLERVR